MRAFALLIALSVLPLFLTSNNIRGADISRFGSLYPDTRIVNITLPSCCCLHRRTSPDQSIENNECTLRKTV